MLLLQYFCINFYNVPRSLLYFLKPLYDIGTKIYKKNLYKGFFIMTTLIYIIEVNYL